MADALAFAEDSEHAFASRARDVVDVQRDNLADSRAGVERDERERLVAWGWAGFDGSQVAGLRAPVKRAGRGGGDLDASGAGGSQAQADVEVIDCGQRVVDGRGLAFEDRLQVGAVVAHPPVAGVGAGEWVAVEVSDSQPGQVLPDLRGVGAASLGAERSRREVAGVGVEHPGEGGGQVQRSSPSTPLRAGGRVL